MNVHGFTYVRHADPHRSNDWVPGYKANCMWWENGEQRTAEWDRHELEELLALFDAQGVTYVYSLIDHWTGALITTETVHPVDTRYVGPYDGVWLLDHPTLDVVGLYFDYATAWEEFANAYSKSCDLGVPGEVLNQFRLTETTCDQLEVPDLVRLLGRQSIIDYLNDF